MSTEYSSSNRTRTLPNRVSIENQYFNQDQYVLKSPPKGKIYKGSIKNAYNRVSLGSIPQKYENVIFRDELCSNKLGFNSQVPRFHNALEGSQYITTMKTEPSMNYTDRDKRCIQNASSPSFSSKGYGVGFVSKAERFSDEYDSYKAKFQPGPGEHNQFVNTINTNISKSNTYKSLHLSSSKESACLLSNGLPGPGEYDIQKSFIKPNFGNKQWTVKKEFERLQKFENKSEADETKDTKLSSIISCELINKDNTLASNSNTKSTSKPTDSKDGKIEMNNIKKELIQRQSIEKKIDEILDIKEAKSQQLLKKSITEIANMEAKADDLKKKKLKKLRLTEFKYRLEEENLPKANDCLYVANLKSKEANTSLIKSSFTPQVEDFYAKYKKMSLKASHYFISKSPKIKHDKANHNPGPSYYTPFILPPKLSFNVYNSIFRNNLEYTNEKKWV